MMKKAGLAALLVFVLMLAAVTAFEKMSCDNRRLCP
jgi:hypothetical protein